MVKGLRRLRVFGLAHGIGIYRLPHSPHPRSARLRTFTNRFWGQSRVNIGLLSLTALDPTVAVVCPIRYRHAAFG